MKTVIHDALIHIASTLDDHAFNNLAERIRQTRGVISIGRDAQRPRFISIGYRPDRTSSMDILCRVVECGHRACMIENLRIMQ